jgi:hypothetical protein
MAGDTGTLRHRIAARRLLWITGVVPPTLLALAIFWIIWGPNVAWQHALLSLAVGAVLVELLLAGLKGVPCAEPYAPGGARLQSRWPWYLLLLVSLNIYVPQAEAMLLGGSSGVPILAGVLAVDALIVRLWADRRHRLGIDRLQADEVTLIDLKGTSV